MEELTDEMHLLIHPEYEIKASSGDFKVVIGA